MVKKGTSHISQKDRLTKIEGQIKGVIKMIEEERYCVDILAQLRSMQSALRSVEREIVRDHIEACVKDAAESGSHKNMRDHLNEISDLLNIAYK